MIIFISFKNMANDDLYLTISRALSYSVIVLSLLAKLPQVWRTYSAKSSRGMSTRGQWLELIAYQIGISYAYYYGYHITTYLDVIVCATQSSLILIMILYYNNQFNFENILLIALFFLFIILSLLLLIPPSLLYIFVLSGIPVSAGSKLLQIYSLYKSKNSADVSTATWTIVTYCCMARVYSLSIEISGEYAIIYNYAISALLNSIIVFQCFLYSQKKTKQF
ncbi:PREDICTED: PQ-loop repeat-containing protein 3-like [Amphimedon queenslandica]|uniref:Solute carrier family 66 member 3 n=2 Tax=Amphimedon queenslandica TaxID=400682 RepID=A0AAN0JHF9_AMPQE|nr:PREDICTED: PQ-loop repeat-containing protein 3-like [Amphimedon queenslandica]|eukprot:XP_019856231.1 PREDICTED: PQ-loop repeat-containing protein 3-like [Amphimedon queenslandica]